MPITGSAENILVSMFLKAKPDRGEKKPEPHLVKLKTVLERIKSEKVMDKILKVREQPTKELSNEVKVNELPVICFSGEFKDYRHGDNLIRHTGLICLDFDKLKESEIINKKRFLSEFPFVVSVFISPSGRGLKAVVRVFEGNKHDGHYLSLLKDFPDADISTKDIARACFECADKDIYINYNATPYSKIIEIEKKTIKVDISKATGTDFDKIEKWLHRKNKIYESGNRNNFIFALASACCRFGIQQAETESLIDINYLSKDGEFTTNEMLKCIKSAYASNEFGSAMFSNENLVDRTTTKEIEIDLNTEVKDVIYGKDVYGDAINLYSNGYVSAESTGITSIDRLFKWKRGELSVLTGIGNYGKSEWLKFIMLNKSVKDGAKWALFSPENFPAHEFYHDLAETLIGCNCTPFNSDGTQNFDQPSETVYKKAYDFVSEHFFYIYPKDVAPTPEYIRTRFLELILKEKIDGVVIDPFNQLTNDYNGGRDDKYLESFLAECSRFAVRNNVYYMIVAHPHKLQKDKDTKAYPAPDVFDLAGGAMWNNKVENILVYHRPNKHVDPMDRTCEFIARKIRKQKTVGVSGVETFEYNRRKRQFIFDDYPIKNFDLGRIAIPDNKTFKNYSEPTSNEVEEDAPF